MHAYGLGWHNNIYLLFNPYYEFYPFITNNNCFTKEHGAWAKSGCVPGTPNQPLPICFRVQKSGRVSGTPNFWPTHQGGFLVHTAHGHNVLLDVEEPQYPNGCRSCHHETSRFAWASKLRHMTLRGKKQQNRTCQNFISKQETLF